jgi:hypothetical protein
MNRKELIDSIYNQKFSWTPKEDKQRRKSSPISFYIGLGIGQYFDVGISITEEYIVLMLGYKEFNIKRG